MPTLTGTKPALTYTYLLQVDGGLDGTLKTVEDGAGNDTPLQMSTDEVAIAGYLQLLANNHSVSLGLDPSAAADYTVLFPSNIAPSSSYVLNVTSIAGGVMQLGWTSVMGTPGSTWYSGSGVPSGGTGVNGDYYFRTSNGSIYTKTSGSWGSPIANITGATGATGSAGTAGTNGATWFSGSGTPSGGTGVNGDFYFETSNGAVYKKVSGAWGSAIANLTGPTGAAGADGVDGSTWYSGTAVPSGGTGVSGDYYFRTSTGDVYQKAGVSWGTSIANITGPTGATGATGSGAVWYSGSGAPSGGTGVDGDFYFRTSTGDVYKKVSGSWGSPIANLTGSTGATGSAGTNGSIWYSGAGTPSGGTGVNGDYYLNTSTGDVYTKTSGSWGSPIENITGSGGSSSSNMVLSIGFNIPALGTPITLTPTVLVPWLVSGMTLFVQDGTTAVYGTASSLTGTTFDFTPDIIATGTVGSFVNGGAIVISAGENIYGAATVGKVLTGNTTGPATFQNSSSNMVLSGGFNIPAIGTPTTLTPTILLPWLITGMTLFIQDGTTAVYGTATSITSTTFDFTPDIIATGTVGSFMNGGAIVVSAGEHIYGYGTLGQTLTSNGPGVPATFQNSSSNMALSTGFNVPAIATPTTLTPAIMMPWLITGMTLFIQDGTTAVFGTATSITSTTFDFTPDIIVAGTVGSFVNGGAIVTSAAETTGGGSVVWYNGSGAPSGGTGVDGDFYLDTANGDVYTKTSGSWGSPITNIMGPPGSTGSTGGAGTPGSIWYSGSGVPSGGTGVNGDYYLRTTTGDIYTKSAGSWGSSIENITGPTGSPGTSSTWYSGAGAPSGGTGLDGDFYVDTTNADMYQKVAGSWGSPISNFVSAVGVSNGITNTSGTLGLGLITPVGIQSSDEVDITVTDASTNSQTRMFWIRHRSSLTPVAGFGVNEFVSLDSDASSGSDRLAYTILTTWVDPADATRKARSVYSIGDTVAREVMRFEASGTAAMIGFLGASAVVQQTGDVGAALVALGLMSGTPTVSGGAAATSATTGTMTVNMTSSVVTCTPSGNCTFNASGGTAGQRVTFCITTSGGTSRTLTFGTNFITTGTLATGTTTGKRFSISFVCTDGTNWQETGRTAAM